jgi:hypothetical protein
MELLLYVVVASVIWLTLPKIVRLTRTRWLAYTGLSIRLAVAGAVLYLLISVWAGIITFGEPNTRSIPSDYFSHGFAGVFALVLFVVGTLSPLAAAWITRSAKRSVQ